MTAEWRETKDMRTKTIAPLEQKIEFQYERMPMKQHQNYFIDNLLYQDVKRSSIFNFGKES